MTVREVCEAIGLNVVSPGDGTREVKGAIVGDRLSHVLGEAQEGWLWVTIQVHLNVSAVAVLKDLPLIVLTSDRRPQDDLAEKCREEGLTLATTSLTSYDLACRLCRLGVGDA
jgi:hypothetical protein